MDIAVSALSFKKGWKIVKAEPRAQRPGSREVRGWVTELSGGRGTHMRLAVSEEPLGLVTEAGACFPALLLSP